MAEVIGLVAGLTSLGIELHDKLSKYIETVRTQDEHVQTLSRQSSALRDALMSIQSSIGKPSIAQHVEQCQAVRARLGDCERDLKLVEDELAICESAHKQVPGADLKDRVRTTAKRLTFPNTREKLSKLEGRLKTANDTLQLVVHALQVYVMEKSNHSLSSCRHETASNFVLP